MKITGKFSLRITITLFLLILSISLSAQRMDINQNLMLSPVQATTQNKLELQRKIQLDSPPKEGDEIILPNGDVAVWRSVSNWLSLNQNKFNNVDQYLTYGYQNIILQQPTSIRINLSSKSLWQAWINGLEISSAERWTIADLPAESDFFIQLRGKITDLFFSSNLKFEVETILLQGGVRDRWGKPIAGATIQLQSKHDQNTSTQTDSEGRYYLLLNAAYDRLHLSAFTSTKCEWKTLDNLRLGTERLVNFELRNGFNTISGSVLMLDQAQSPQVNINVQAIQLTDSANQKGEVAETVKTNERGFYQFSKLRVGRYKIVCHTANKLIEYRDRDHLERSGKIFNLKVENQYRDINFFTAPIKKGRWSHLSQLDGLAGNQVNNVYRSSKGILWLATENGISRYDGFNFTNFGFQDGIQLKHIRHIYESSDGTIWFAAIGGVIGYKNYQFTQYIKMGSVEGPIVLGIAETVDNQILFWTQKGI